MGKRRVGGKWVGKTRVGNWLETNNPHLLT